MKRILAIAILVAAIGAGVATAASSGPSLTNPSSLKLKAPATFKAQFVTTKGTFVITVTRSWAPIGADRFYNLVYYHFYDNQPIYRVAPGFVVQWGISMTPKIAKAWQYAYIKDDPQTHPNAKGTVTFAHVLGGSGKNTRTTQLFVNLRQNDGSLGKSFAPFGVISSGMSVFSQLYHGPNAKGYYAYNFQSDMINYGGWWVKKYFPKLDWIKTARIVG